MTKPVILCDLDGCVTDLWGTVSRFRAWDRLPPLPVPQQYDAADLSGLDQHYLQRVFQDLRFYQKMRPLPGAKPSLWTLSQHYDITYITARGVSIGEDGELVFNRPMQDITIQWLLDWELPEGELFPSPVERKGELAQAYYGSRVAFAIEDNADAAQGYIERGIHTYLVLYPYNRHIPISSNLTRIDNLTQISWHRELLIDNPPIQRETTGTGDTHGIHHEDTTHTCDCPDSGDCNCSCNRGPDKHRNQAPEGG